MNRNPVAVISVIRQIFLIIKIVHSMQDLKVGNATSVITIKDLSTVVKGENASFFTAIAFADIETIDHRFRNVWLPTILDFGKPGQHPTISAIPRADSTMDLRVSSTPSRHSTITSIAFIRCSKHTSIAWRSTNSPQGSSQSYTVTGFSSTCTQSTPSSIVSRSALLRWRIQTCAMISASFYSICGMQQIPSAGFPLTLQRSRRGIFLSSVPLYHDWYLSLKEIHSWCTTTEITTTPYPRRKRVTNSPLRSLPSLGKVVNARARRVANVESVVQRVVYNVYMPTWQMYSDLNYAMRARGREQGITDGPGGFLGGRRPLPKHPPVRPPVPRLKMAVAGDVPVCEGNQEEAGDDLDGFVATIPETFFDLSQADDDPFAITPPTIEDLIESFKED